MTRAKGWCRNMIGAMEKGIEAAKVAKIPDGVYDGVDLKMLPKYICFKAALLRQKATLSVSLLGMGGLFFLYFALSRYEISGLYDQLRTKEYILAPGVLDFTTAAPQTVSDTYVAQAAMEFISQFCNVSPGSIDEQYERLGSSMSPELAVRFRAEAQDWKAKVKQENISEICAVTSRQIASDERGNYRVVATIKASSFVGSESLGAREEVIEMLMHLVPPKDGKRWFLEITSLSKFSKDAYKVQKSMEGR